MFFIFKFFQIQFSPEFIFGRHIWKILRCKNLLIVFRQSVFHHSITLISTEYDSNRRIIAFIHHLAGVVIHIHLHLSYILMCKIAYLQIYQDKTLQNVIIENQINIEMASIHIKVLLSCYEGVTSSQFKQKLL